MENNPTNALTTNTLTTDLVTTHTETDSDTSALKESVTQALKEIFDPEIPVNIYDLGLIYDLITDETGNIEIKMTLTTPMCPVAQTFPQTVQDRVLNVPGVTGVRVELVWEPPWTKDRMSEAAQLQLNLF